MIDESADAVVPVNSIFHAIDTANAVLIQVQFLNRHPEHRAETELFVKIEETIKELADILASIRDSIAASSSS